MGFLRPDIETRQPRSQATPFAEDILTTLRRQVEGGTFGSGFGPLQRQAGTSIQQFVESGAGGRFEPDPVRDIDLTPVDIQNMVQNLEGVQQRSSTRALANTREAVGAGGGGRFGTGAARAIGDTATDLETAFTTQIDDLLRQQQQVQLGAQQAGVQRDLAVNEQGFSAFESELARMLSAITAMQNFGTQNVAQGFGLASQGILPEETIVSDSPATSFLNTLAQFAPAIAEVLTGRQNENRIPRGGDALSFGNPATGGSPAPGRTF